MVTYLKPPVPAAESEGIHNRSFNRIVNILLQPIGAKIAYLAKAEGFCRWGYYTGILQSLADQCGSNNKRGISLRDTQSPIKIGDFRAWSYQAQAFDAGRIYIEVYNTTITTNDYSDISVYSTPLSSIPEATSSRSALYKTAVANHDLALSGKRDQASSLAMDVYVKNSHGSIIGQVLSDGYSIQYSPLNDGAFEVCVTKRSDISENSCFDTIDFASGSPLAPLGAALSYMDDKVVCADFINTNTIFIIGRVVSWENAMTDQCVTPSTDNTHGSSASILVSCFSLIFGIVLAQLF